MGHKKLLKKLANSIKSEIDSSWSVGYEAGYADGSRDATADGFEEGVAAHKEMIRVRLTGLFDTYMSTNKFAKAKDAKEMLEYLEWEYDPEKAEAEAKADDDKWF